MGGLLPPQLLDSPVSGETGALRSLKKKCIAHIIKYVLLMVFGAIRFVARTVGACEY